MFYQEESDIYTTVITFLQDYGWYLFFLSIILYYIYDQYGRSYVEKYKAYKFEKEYAAKYHKNPDLFSERLSQQQKFVEKLQEKYNNAAKTYEEKQKEREERKNLEKLEKLGGPAGHQLGNKSDEKKTTFRPEYNPLMGPGSSSNYRPPKRSACGGGGCGKK